MPVRLALYSDQEIAANRSMDERVMRLIGRPRPRIGYVACELRQAQLAFEAKRAYYAELDAELALCVDERTQPFAPAFDALLRCDAIHLSGGNTFAFLHWLRARGCIDRLVRHARAGGVLIGASAGAILMTPSVRTAVLCGDLRGRQHVDDAALALTRFHFWPHYQPGAERRWRTRARIAAAGLLYACPDGSGVVVDGERVERHGDVRVFGSGE
jgi:dipeptidase E